MIDIISTFGMAIAVYPLPDAKLQNSICSAKLSEYISTSFVSGEPTYKRVHKSNFVHYFLNNNSFQTSGISALVHGFRFEEHFITLKRIRELVVNPSMYGDEKARQIIMLTNSFDDIETREVIYENCILFMNLRSMFGLIETKPTLVVCERHVRRCKCPHCVSY